MTSKRPDASKYINRMKAALNGRLSQERRDKAAAWLENEIANRPDLHKPDDGQGCAYIGGYPKR